MSDELLEQLKKTIASITPEQLAEIFAAYDSSEQARFYNHLADVSTPWLTTQLQYITDEDGLTLAGRRCMMYIGDYSHWGLVPSHYELFGNDEE